MHLELDCQPRTIKDLVPIRKDIAQIGFHSDITQNTQTKLPATRSEALLTMQ